MVFVDPLMTHGWVLRGRPTMSCHMFTNGDLDALHALAEAIGLKRSWFQTGSLPHYDLTPSKRDAALVAGAVALDRHQAVAMWREMRAIK